MIYNVLSVSAVQQSNPVIPMYAFSLFFFLAFCLFRPAPSAYGGSHARGLIGAIAAGLRHSHSNARSEPHLNLHHSSRQCRILNPLGEARDWTCYLTVPSWIRFCCSTMGTPAFSFSHYLHQVPSQVIRYISLCYTAGSHCLSTLNAVVCIY